MKSEDSSRKVLIGKVQPPRLPSFGAGSAGLKSGLQPVVGESKVGFYLVLLAMLFEFGRPQDFFPPLKAIPFPSLVYGALTLAVFLSGKVSFADKQTKLWIALLSFMALWVPFATNNFKALMTFKDMALYFFFYLGIITFVNSAERMQKLIFMWLGVHGILAVNGILHHGQGVGGWLGDENDFGMEMNVAVPIAFFMFQAEKKQRTKLLYILLLGIFIMSVVATSSRGAFLGLLVIAAYCWFYSPRKVMSLVLGVCLMGVVLLAAPQEYWDRISSITEDKTMEEGTAGQRMFTWGIGWEMFLSNPVFGVGQANFPWTIGDYLGGRTWQTKSLAGRQAHSLYFTLLPELGLVGVIIFGSMIFFNYKDLRLRDLSNVGQQKPWARNTEKIKDDSPEMAQAIMFGKAILGGMIGYLVTSTFISTLYYPTFWIMMGLAVALRKTSNTYSEKHPESKSAPTHMWSTTLPMRPLRRHPRTV